MVTPDDVRHDLRNALLSSFSNEYNAILETWKVLEGKAQASVTIAGIFFAAAFAYVRDVGHLVWHDKLLLAITILVLSFSVLSALLALRIVQITAPPLGHAIEPYVTDLLNLDETELNAEHLRRFDYDCLSLWRDAISAARAMCSAKAIYVWRSQLLLATSMIPIIIVTVVRLI